MNYLGNFFGYLNNLNTLILKNYGINDESVGILIEAFIKYNKICTKLDLSDNKLTSNCAKIFNNYFKLMSTIQENKKKIIQSKMKLTQT